MNIFEKFKQHKEAKEQLNAIKELVCEKRSIKPPRNPINKKSLAGIAIYLQEEIDEFLKLDAVYPQEKLNELKTAKAYAKKIQKLLPSYTFDYEEIHDIKEALVKQTARFMGTEVELHTFVEEYTQLCIINGCSMAIEQIMKEVNIDKDLSKCCKYINTYLDKFLQYVIDEDNKTIYLSENKIRELESVLGGAIWN